MIGNLYSEKCIAALTDPGTRKIVVNTFCDNLSKYNQQQPLLGQLNESTQKVFNDLKVEGCDVTGMLNQDVATISQPGTISDVVNALAVATGFPDLVASSASITCPALKTALATVPPISF